MARKGFDLVRILSTTERSRETYVTHSKVHYHVLETPLSSNLTFAKTSGIKKNKTKTYYFLL